MLDLILEKINKKYPFANVSAFEAKHKIELETIKVPEEKQNANVGSDIIRMLQSYAKRVGKPIVIRPEADKGKKEALNRFYKKLGFVKNSGRNMDYTLSSPVATTMYWKESSIYNFMNFKVWINESTNKTLSGWLAPNGKFYECKRAIFDHLNVIETTIEIKRLMPSWFEEKLQRLKNLQKELESTEDHPEWHSYDAMKDSIEISVYDEMYKKGFLRVASHSDEVYFEGTSSGISNLYNKAKDLADQNNLKAVFMKVSF